MKYSTIIVSLAAGVFALPQDQSTITSAPASAASGSLTPQQSCALYSCQAGDVTCQASCLGIARPNSSQAVETTECAAKCDQGDGSPEATEKYSECVQSCIASLFPSSQTAGLPAAASGASNAASNAASATGAAASAASSGASRAASGTTAQPTGSATGSGAASSSTPTGAAKSNNVQVAGAGLVGIVLAMFAL
ncbi:hypothetical protein BDV96DRAFT_684919 [Lophiotrema nucula]|uniref:Extracellular membrane protein CFEM domain-containing protein n=1 Tax=Lophiotrema nucula TaxID=690887 RepID=A0A6A5ZHI8_9PLEO|nr:hypothetical protein BDV96DRAFT_684919 [Lophiotrema nucula]